MKAANRFDLVKAVSESLEGEIFNYAATCSKKCIYCMNNCIFALEHDFEVKGDLVRRFWVLMFLDCLLHKNICVLVP